MREPQPLPEDALTRRVAAWTGAGTFEAHVTVEANWPAECERFRSVCRNLGVKAVLIELAAGMTPTQPMTSSYHRGTIQQAADEVAAVTRSLRQAGFAIQRLKLEAVATNTGVPESDAEACDFPPNCYFEFHIKLALPADADRARLQALCDRFAARLSRNALKRDPQGVSERFVNLRLYGVGRTTAFQRLDEVLAALADAGFDVLNKEREYSVFDSRIDLDAGWMEAPTGESA